MRTQQKLYSQCPKCQTVFAVQSGILRQRDGLVRCGYCASIFKAEQHLYAVTDGAYPAELSVDTQKLKPRNKKTKPRPNRVRPRRPAATKIKAADEKQNQTADKIQALPKQEAHAVSAQKAPVPELSVEEILGVIRRPQTRPVFWFLGIVLLLSTLSAQLAFFHRDELARRQGQVRDYVLTACRYFRCEVTLPRDLDRIVLTNTVVAPHPQYQQVLRIRAMLVNRAEFVQPFPLLEVSLINTRGQIVARRAFEPEQYLKGGVPQARKGMPFNVVQTAELDLTSPAQRAMGYEIRLYAAR